MSLVIWDHTVLPAIQTDRSVLDLPIRRRDVTSWQLPRLRGSYESYGKTRVMDFGRNSRLTIAISIQLKEKIIEYLLLELHVVELT